MRGGGSKDRPPCNQVWNKLPYILLKVCDVRAAAQECTIAMAVLHVTMMAETKATVPGCGGESSILSLEKHR